MKKIWFILSLIFIVSVFSGCGEELVGYEVSLTPYGFTDPNTGIEYEMFSNPISVYALTKDEPLFHDGTEQYYSIKFENSRQYICDKNNTVFKATNLPDLTIGEFNPVSALIYYGEAYLETFYCEEKYRDPDASFPEDAEFQDDSEYVYAIRDAILNGEPTQLPVETIEDDTFLIRMLGPDYPGLYYSVVFTRDINGKCYLYDRATKTAVYAPQNVKERFLGDE